MIPYNKDTAYKAAGLGGTKVTDVQIDGVSIVEDKIASIPYATVDDAGVVKVGEGLKVEDGVLSTDGGGAEYTFTDGLTETDGTVAWDYNGDFTKNASTGLVTINPTSLTLAPTNGQVTIKGNAISLATGPSWDTYVKCEFGSIWIRDGQDRTDTTRGVEINGQIGFESIAPHDYERAMTLGKKSGNGTTWCIGNSYYRDNGVMELHNPNRTSQVTGSTTYKKIVNAANSVPDSPTSDGNYVLKCTVTGGVPTYTWVAE